MPMERGRPSWWDDAVNHLSEDPLLGNIVQTYHGEGLNGKGDVFQTLVRSIVGQQISVLAADAIHARLEELCGEISKESVSDYSPDELAKCGLTKPKSKYIHGIATSTIPLLPENYDKLSDGELMKHFIQFKGIGPWTAEMLLMFSLMRPDVLSLGDLGIVKAIRNLVPGAETNQQLEAVAEAWRPFRTAACWYLWRTLDPVPVEY